jgi:hypothetical protein
MNERVDKWKSWICDDKVQSVYLFEGDKKSDDDVLSEDERRDDFLGSLVEVVKE